MSTKTRDNIYEYIFLTRLETAVSSHPLCLRLHYIHQNSFSFLTYPTAHMQRYPHSLGVMHMAGLMFSHATANTIETTIIDHLLSYTELAIKKYSGINIDAIVDECRNNKNKLITQESIYNAIVGPNRLLDKTDPKKYLSLIVLFQSVRLAALLHDIGHPPFSHIIEYALQESLPGKYSNHEKVGQKLATVIFQELGDPASSVASDFVQGNILFSRACFCLTEALMKDSEPNFHGLYKTLFSGEIDADRLDYVRRDIESTGLTTTSYDTGRILDGLFFRKSREDGAIEVCLSPNSLSAVETFFAARFHLYRWAIYHHDVVRRNLSIQRALNILLTSNAPDLPAEVINFRDKLLDIVTDSADPVAYKRFTDGFLLELLWAVFGAIDRRLAGASQKTIDLHLFLDVVLNRKNSRLQSLWKRPDHYADFCASVYRKDPKSKGEPKRNLVILFNKEINDIFERKFPEERYTKHVGRLVFARTLEEVINKKIGLEGHRLHIYYIAKFHAAPTPDYYLSEQGDERTIQMEDVSPILFSLRTAWDVSPHMLIFYEVNQTTRDLSREVLFNTYNAAVLSAIKELKQS